MPPIYEQGQIGSCTANAAARLYQYELYRQHLPDFMPSRLFDYYNERLLQGDPGADDGATVKNAMDALKGYGTVPESEWPYSENPLRAPTPSLYGSALQNVVTSYASVQQDALAIESAIASGHPVQFGIMAYASFESQAVADTGLVPMPDARTDALLGGHSVVATGYMHGESWWVANSWGTAWGIGGYCQMPWAYLLDPDLAGDFFVINAEL